MRYIGALTNLLTVDPNFHQDIQVVVYQGFQATNWSFAARGQELLVTGRVDKLPTHKASPNTSNK